VIVDVIEFCGRKADMDDFQGGESILDESDQLPGQGSTDTHFE